MSPGGKRRFPRPSIGAVLGIVATVVAVAGGIAALLFTLDPSLKPCLGGTRVAITAAVFPRAERHGGLVFASVRYTITTDGLRGTPLLVRYSVFHVDASGLVAGVVPGWSRVKADGVSPETCSDQGGHDIPVLISVRGRYRILLEVFRGSAQTENRLVLTETPTFRD
jgi:hypothetical protein